MSAAENTRGSQATGNTHIFENVSVHYPGVSWSALYGQVRRDKWENSCLGSKISTPKGRFQKRWTLEIKYNSSSIDFQEI